MMAGPVMGITVTGDEPRACAVRRARRAGSCGSSRASMPAAPDAEPAFGYTLDDGERAAPPPPVSAGADDRAQARRAGQHHGRERAARADGRALARHRAGELLRRRRRTIAGDSQRIAPAIAPGGSFEARFTPPRSGTFIYHTHIDEMRQQQAGLSGALLVVDDPAAYDPVARPRDARDRAATRRPTTVSCCSTARRRRRAREMRVGRALSPPLHQRSHVPAAACACGCCGTRRC